MEEIENKTTEDESARNGIKRNEDGTFTIGTAPGPGRPPETTEQKIIKKATKELIAEYKESLGEALPLIKPILIAKALDGDMSAIKEIHDRVMDKSKQPTDITTGGEPIQLNIVNYGTNNTAPIPTEEIPNTDIPSV